jgi:hypothetical protein
VNELRRFATLYRNDILHLLLQIPLQQVKKKKEKEKRWSSKT